MPTCKGIEQMNEENSHTSLCFKHHDPNDIWLPSFLVFQPMTYFERMEIPAFRSHYQSVTYVFFFIMPCNFIIIYMNHGWDRVVGKRVKRSHTSSWRSKIGHHKQIIKNIIQSVTALTLIMMLFENKKIIWNSSRNK